MVEVLFHSFRLADGLDSDLVAVSADDAVETPVGEPGELVDEGQAEGAHDDSGVVFVVHGVALVGDDVEALLLENAGDLGGVEAGDAVAGVIASAG